MSLVVSVSLQCVKDALQQQRPHAPQPWEGLARRWLRVEDLAPIHGVGQADMGKMVVLEGAEYWACVCVEHGGPDWILVTASRLLRQGSRGPTCYGVPRDHLWSLGPMHRARRCLPESIPTTPPVFVEVMKEPRVPARDVWPVIPSNVW